MELAQKVDYSGIQGDTARIGVHQQGAILVDHTTASATLARELKASVARFRVG